MKEGKEIVLRAAYLVADAEHVDVLLGLEDLHRGATRYDKLVRNFLSAVAVATLIAFWV